jgi:hypothetical protein
MAATVEESTPPDMATAIVLLGGLGIVPQFYFLRVAGGAPPGGYLFGLVAYFHGLARFQQSKILNLDGLDVKILFLKGIAPTCGPGLSHSFS